MNMRTFLGLGAVLSVALGLGCYDPNYPANLRCGGTNLDKCPKDFKPAGTGTSCICVKDGTALGGAGGGTGGAGGSGGGGMGGGGGAMGGAGGGVGGAGGGMGGSGGGGMCVGPVACTISSSQGTCDPACQKGCACDQRCVIDNALKPTCTVPLSPSELKPTYARCEVPMGKRVDNCQAGNVCLGEQVNPDACGSHCYRVCRVDADCPGGAHCSQSLTSQDFTPDCTKPGELCYCDNPNVKCNPITMDATASCGRGPNYSCYLAGARFPDETVCDCIGTKGEGEACAIERECKPGLVCVDANDGQMGKCRRVCPRNAAPNFCGSGRTCRQFFASTMYGFCYAPPI